MDCDGAREALSGSLDGEAAAGDPADLEAHLARCGPCRRWLAAAREVTRRARLRVAPAVPDLTDRVLAAVQLETPRRPPAPAPAVRDRGLRLALLLVAVTQLVLAIPVLLLGHDHAAPEHIARELGSFDLALAVGFLAAVHRPARAAGMLAMVGVAAAGLVLTAAVDLVDGHVAPLEEAPHLLALAGWLLLCALAGPAAHDPRPRRTELVPHRMRRAASLHGLALGFAVEPELAAGSARTSAGVGCTMEGDAHDVRAPHDVPPALRDSA